MLNRLPIKLNPDIFVREVTECAIIHLIFDT